MKVEIEKTEITKVTPSTNEIDVCEKFTKRERWGESGIRIAT
jgi:hypothetical protein